MVCCVSDCFDRLPLFMTKGTESRKYLRAVILLNRNIIQLIRARDLYVPISRDLFVNLRNLMNTKGDSATGSTSNAKS